MSTTIRKLPNGDEYILGINIREFDENVREQYRKAMNQRRLDKILKRGFLALEIEAGIRGGGKLQNFSCLVDR
jgi:hypothetical protein